MTLKVSSVCILLGFSVSCVSSSGTTRRQDAGLEVSTTDSTAETHVGDSIALDSHADATRALLAEVDAQIVAPAIVRLQERNNALISALTALHAEPANTTLRTAAQNAWRETMEVWQTLALFEIGPFTSPLLGLGGEDLGAEIYAWPFVNACRIDHETIRETYRNAENFAALNVGMRGLAAIEYVLFTSTTNNACGAAYSINTDGSWAQLDAATITLRRVEYAQAAAALVATRAERARIAWGEFAADWVRAGAGSTRFDSAQRGLNVLSDGMYYLPHDIKDLKVGHPLGVAGCLSADCIGTEESLWAEASVSHLRNNFAGFSRVFFGRDDNQPSLAGLLRGRGRADVVDHIRTALTAANAALDSLQGPIGASIRNQREQVTALHEALRSINNLYKTEFVSVLDIELPRAAEGDND